MNAPLTPEERLMASLAALYHADLIEDLSSQFDTAFLTEEQLMQLANVLSSLYSTCKLAFGCEPVDTFEDLVIAHARAIMVLGRRTGTLSFAVSEENEMDNP